MIRKLKASYRTVEPFPSPKEEADTLPESSQYRPDQAFESTKQVPNFLDWVASKEIASHAQIFTICQSVQSHVSYYRVYFCRHIFYVISLEMDAIIIKYLENYEYT